MMLPELRSTSGIARARKRLVVIAPAVSDAVARALEARLAEGSAAATVILDADPEVYRLGYGTEAAFDRIHDAAARNQLDLRIQKGVRIGVVISDNVTIVFSPVPLLIEAGSSSIEKPNAIILSGNPAEKLADAAGVGRAECSLRQEIGTEELKPADTAALKEDLKNNPPQQFDIQRLLRVFSSKIQYVELKVKNYRVGDRQIPIRKELLGINDDSLRSRVSARIRGPASEIGPQKVKCKTKNGEEEIEVDQKWIEGQRKQMEDDYIFVVPGFGRVVLSYRRAAFDEAIRRLEHNLAGYFKAITEALENISDEFEESVVREYLPRWCEQPPSVFQDYGLQATSENLEEHLREMAKEMVREATELEPPRISVIYKNIAPESVDNIEFLEPLRDVMRRRGVPTKIITSLFTAGDVAPASGRFVE